MVGFDQLPKSLLDPFFEAVHKFIVRDRLVYSGPCGGVFRDVKDRRGQQGLVGRLPAQAMPRPTRPAVVPKG